MATNIRYDDRLEGSSNYLKWKVQISVVLKETSCGILLIQRWFHQQMIQLLLISMRSRRPRCRGLFLMGSKIISYLIYYRRILPKRWGCAQETISERPSKSKDDAQIQVAWRKKVQGQERGILFV